jgi:hypothetical protein
MNFAGLFIALLIPLILLGLAWILGSPLEQEISLHPVGTIEDLLPLHSRHFPQLRQSLDPGDAHYIRRRVSQEVERFWCDARRQIVRDYLTGLAGDYARVLQLARIVDSLSPNLLKRTLVKRYWLALRFRFLYRAISVCMTGGGPAALPWIARLTDYVGSLSALEESAMGRLERLGDEGEAHANFNA